MSNAISGIGTIFNRWDGSQWVKLAEVVSIDGPSKTRNTIDVTSLDSVGGYMEFIGALRDGGEISFNMNFTAASYALMNTDFEDDTLQDYQIVLPDATNTTFEFEGLVTDLPIAIPMDDKLSCDVKIKVSGQTTVKNVKVIVSAAAINSINVVNGTQLSAVGLPATATVTYDDGTTGTPAVVWNAGTPVYNGASAATYVFSGTITCPSGTINPDNVKAAVNVVVAP